jgi:hypothetical protein
MMDYLEPVLAKLGYSPGWLEYGFIDEDMLREQSKQYDISTDKHTEHYRYAAFRAVLRKRVALDDMFLEKYIHLAQLDEDQSMAQAALMLLIGWPHLSDLQLERLSAHPAFALPVLQRQIERIRLLRQLRSSPLTEELFERCIVSRDETVQRELLERSDISRQQVEVLQERGANMAIRNISKQRLHKRH